MNQENIARIIVAVGYTLAKKYPPSSIKITEGGADEQQYSYSGSFAEGGFQLRENPGGEYLEVKPVSNSGEFIVQCSNQEVVKIKISGSSGNAQDTYNSRSYYSINFTSNSISLDGISFRVS